MEGTYVVNSSGQAVGSVIITKQGLFYHFCCRCKLSGEDMVRLIMEVDGTSMDLGILVPVDGCFGLNSRLSIKKHEKGKLRFYLKLQKDTSTDGLVSICPQEPFRYISKLESAYLTRRNGILMVGFREEK